MVFRDQKILLLRRASWAPLFGGYWHCPTGKIEAGESPRNAIIREAFEEIGLNLEPELGTIVAVKTRSFKNPIEDWEDMSLFFVEKNLNGEPINKELRLHDQMDWFAIDQLPDPIIPVVKFGILQYSRGELYGEFGYDEPSSTFV